MNEIRNWALQEQLSEEAAEPIGHLVCWFILLIGHLAANNEAALLVLIKLDRHRQVHARCSHLRVTINVIR